MKPSTINLDLYNIELDVICFLHAGEKETLHDPYEPPMVEIEQVLHNGEDILRLLSEEVYEELEFKILKDYKEPKRRWAA